MQQTMRSCLPSLAIGELEAIRNLPGTPRALLATLGKCWRAGYDLQANAHANPRIESLAVVDTALRAGLPRSMLVPPDLAAAALARIALAPVLLGRVTLMGLAELDACWQPLLLALAQVTPVMWCARQNAVPDWLTGSAVEVTQEVARTPHRRIISAARAAHEALEAMRWVRGLLASGQVQASEIALVSVNTAEYDDALLGLSQETGIALHFAHGRPVAATREGQCAAALADVLLHGPTRRRLRRCQLQALPDGWVRALPPRLTLHSPHSWRRALARVTAADWPVGADGTAALKAVIDLLLEGPAAAEKVGETLLSGRALAIWRRALLAGPAEALMETIANLRQDDGLDSCVNVSWMPAAMLATAPRAYVWLLGMNAGSWPRQSREDVLLPAHIVPARVLEPCSLADADRQAYASLSTACSELICSYSRCDGAGRHASASVLLRGADTCEHRAWNAPAQHAASEADRLFGRIQEFAATSHAVSARAVWRDWHAAAITPHDGLIRSGHPAMHGLIGRVHSASSLRTLLRNPIAYLWRYGLKWSAPEAEDELLELDAVQFGRLVHAISQEALEHLEASVTYFRSSGEQRKSALQQAIATVAQRWEEAESVPPAALWQRTLTMAGVAASAALEFGHGSLPDGKAYAEVGFGGAQNGGARLPWDVNAPVIVPGTGLAIKGVIDRLDISADGRLAAVRDYKTGSRGVSADATLDGGAELQRSLYALAVRTLLSQVEEVRASLFYTRDLRDVPLQTPEEAMDKLCTALLAASQSFSAGNALAGPDAGDDYDDFALLLPANRQYLSRKQEAVRAILGDAAMIWEVK
ncbi:PD-(D/E)XK nuclease family protein [Pseudoduganella sp. FT93W]|uniref:PD-(D/E)XK nuclease family protein n=1 Tax=Duganella fentianensis TaxID=2692177 RepID=A0A845I3Q9_9BURK|nr:PD-(D/E)XK nuclease family protein [Duganella fentianensis]MYN45906.1 PD-(D/E)XK nuclease family protein [Duganella fentianensis]